MLDNTHELPEDEQLRLKSLVDSVFESQEGKLLLHQKEKITELNQEIVRLKALLFHFTGEME